MKKGPLKKLFSKNKKPTFLDWVELGITAMEELVKQASKGYDVSLFLYRGISGKEGFLWYLFLNEEN